MRGQPANAPAVGGVKKKEGFRKSFGREWGKNYDLYLLLIPGIIYFLVFKYVPMGGLIIAFKKYNMFQGIWGSEWYGFQHFVNMVNLPDFWKIVRNTLMLSVMSLAVGFPATIILALMLNEIRVRWFKRISQSLLYIPHFMSWIILAGIIYNVLSPRYGVVNTIIRGLGMEEIYFMISESWWITAYIGSGIWQGAGWGTILYLAAISAIDPSLYEAAVVDGAGRFKRIWHVTIPGIMPTIIILLILNIGNLVSVGFEHIFALQNPITLSVSQVIPTFIYNYGIVRGNFDITTAVDTVQSVINLILVLGANYVVRMTGREGFW